MKRYYRFITLYILLYMASSCRQAVQESHQIHSIGGSSLESSSPYLTTDNNGRAVLNWTSKDPSDSLNRLMYAVYDAGQDKFSKPVVVSTSAGTKSSAESMNKVAFKSDGTVMAVFARRFEKEKNPFAGAICYSMSRDDGHSWSPAQYLHTDTAHTYGRGYFDIARLNNGEVGAVWLDGRFKQTQKGSAIFFSVTQKDGGFKGDTCLNKNTCECCRTDLLAGQDGNIHIAYRSIMFPSALMGKQVRDMVYTFSKDNGKTFMPEQVISKDNWTLDGCPHTGPSVAVTKNGLNAVWFTAGGLPGLYHSVASAAGADFKERKLLSVNGRHPQMAALPDGKLVVIYEEAAEEHNASSKAIGKPAHAGMDHHLPSSGARIILRVISGDKPDKTIILTNGKYPDHHAVLTPVKNGLLAAWVREKNGRSDICFTRLESL